MPYYDVKIDVDISKAVKALDTTKKEMRKIARSMMSKVLIAVKADSKKKLRGSLLRKRSGNLLKGFRHKTFSDYSGKVSNIEWYSSFHETGVTILPKGSKYLTFQVNGEWKKVKQIILPKRRFLGDVVDNYFSTSKAEEIMDKILQTALDEIMQS